MWPVLSWVTFWRGLAVKSGAGCLHQARSLPSLSFCSASGCQSRRAGCSAWDALNEAREVVNRYIGSEYELSEIAIDAGERSKFGQMFQGGYGKLLTFVSLFWLLQVAPSFAIHTLQPQLLMGLHVKDPFLATLVITALSLVGIIPSALVLVNALGRRRLLISTFVLMALPLAVIGFEPNTSAWIIILAFIVFTVSESAGSALQYVYPNELFPTNIRATAMGFATAMSRVGAAISTFLLPIGYSTIGAGPSMLVLCGLIILGLMVTIVWAPETKGLTLAEASALGRQQVSKWGRRAG